MWQYNYTDELYHYGVLGMKWGQRRAAKKGTTYQYKSWTTRRYDRLAKKANKKALNSNLKKASKYKSKASKFEQRKRRSQELDAKEQRVAETISTGKVIVARIMTGGLSGMTSKSYMRNRALGRSKINSFIRTAVPITGTIDKARYIRQDEK